MFNGRVIYVPKEDQRNTKGRQKRTKKTKAYQKDQRKTKEGQFFKITCV